ncbi:hypothetical protein HanXRQr2_Chr09g0406021 [Helianthus annuus]|uniref:Uncharacterized protein n=1 Tax=Helianthus annuus TaxID=4232 RepID=A0A9K3N9Y8_HELAN|nr:hypothetical protein HanXRQr2_Chr09g0406021 [Helianthus annuus]KAJ0894698.1 hypothetical protein HanPSC8_Chr09g0391931 [Helianthus annuus]
MQTLTSKSDPFECIGEENLNPTCVEANREQDIMQSFIFRNP